MALIKLKVNYLDNHKRDEFGLMAQLNSITPLNISDVYLGNQSATVTIANYEELETLLVQDSTEKLRDMGLSVTPPASYKSQKTLFLPRVKSFLTNTSPDVLIHRINSANRGRFQATEVIVVLSSGHKEGWLKNLKVTFKTIEQAQEAFTNGFSIGDFNINSKSVFKEDFVEINQCYRCFSYEHFTNKCAAEHPSCSICAGSHNFKACPDKTKIKCFVCGGAHFAISASCPTRKENIKKIKESRPSNKQPPKNNNNSNNQNNNNNSNNPPPANPSLVNSNNFPNLPKSNPNNSPWSRVLKQNLPSTSNNTPDPPNQSQPSAQVQPSAPESPSSDNSLLYLDLWKSIADRIAGPDHTMYITILNAFLSDNGLEPISIPSVVRDIIDNKASKNPAVTSETSNSNNVTESPQDITSSSPQEKQSSSPQENISINPPQETTNSSPQEEEISQASYRLQLSTENLDNIIEEINSNADSASIGSSNDEEIDVEEQESIASQSLESSPCSTESLSPKPKTKTKSKNVLFSKSVMPRDGGTKAISYNFRDRSSSSESLAEKPGTSGVGVGASGAGRSSRNVKK